MRCAAQHCSWQVKELLGVTALELLNVYGVSERNTAMDDMDNGINCGVNTPSHPAACDSTDSDIQG